VAGSPHDFAIDRVYLHGHATKGMKRGIALDCRDAEVRDSYISDIMSLADAQAIAVFNGAGPFTIVNNYLEASGGNVLFGGADPKTPSLVPTNITIRRNHFLKPLAWRNAALATPAQVATSAGGSGALAAGTHYFKIVALMSTGGATVYSGPSTEVAVATGSGGSVAIDALHFTSTTLTGDCDIVARVATIAGTQAWTKVGVMVRTTLDAGAPQAFVLVSIGKGAAFQRRTVAGGGSTSTSGGSRTAPEWVKLSRRGTTITAWVSADGQAWTMVGSDSFSIGDTLLAGLGVSSHDPAVLATGTFDSVQVTPLP